MNSILTQTLTISMVLMSSLAFGADFVFNVPVRIENTNHISNGKIIFDQARIECFVSSELGSYLGTPTVIGSASALMGRENVFVQLNSGNYNDTVKVEIENESRHKTSDAKGYTCSLALRGPLQEEFTPGRGTGIECGMGNSYYGTPCFERKTGRKLEHLVGTVSETF